MDTAEHSSSSAAILEVQDAHKSFGQQEVLRGVSFVLHPHETLGLLGFSGSGKSVLLRSLIALERLDQGKIIFQGHEIQNASEEEFLKIRTKISYAFQNGALFDSLSVYENLAFPLQEHTTLSEDEMEAKIKATLDLVGLGDKMDALPGDLSGGMQKRIGLARSIILQPEIILYDEPTSGLDPSNTKNAMAIIERIKAQGAASIIVTHDMFVALGLCQRIMVLAQGKIAYMGTAEEFKNEDAALIRSFMQNQISEE